MKLDVRNNNAEALLQAIADCAVELLRVPHVHRSLPKILETLGRATSVDRMQFLQVRHDSRTEHTIFSGHACWCAPGIPPSSELNSIVGKSMQNGGFETWAAKFARGEIVAGPSDSFEPGVRKFLEMDGVCSLVVVPIFVGGEWWGQIGFDDCTRIRRWTPAEIDALRTLAELVGTAIQRSQDIVRLANAHRIVESSPTILFRLGARPPYPLKYISENVERYGYGADELVSEPRRWLKLIKQDDIPSLFQAIRSVADGRAEQARAEFRLIKPDGSHVWFDGHSTAHRNSDGKVAAVEGIITDVTERKHSARKIERLAHTDMLTGLANRATFLERLTAMCNSARRNRFAVHFIDLDKFKSVNDTLGHVVGDQLLQTVAQRLLGSVRKTDVVARFGGDEFAILQPNVASLNAAEKLAEKICRTLSAPYRIAGHDIHISASVGLDSGRIGALGPETVLAHADLALYRAKYEGRNCYRVYDPEFRSIIGTALASNLRPLTAA